MTAGITLSEKQMLGNCAFAKTVLMLIIVLYHCMLFWGENWFIGKPIISAPVLGYISSWLNSWHVYAFALISGYIFSFKMSSNNYDNYYTFVFKKIKRLIVPYVFIMFFWVLPISDYYFNFTTQEIVNKYILAESPSQLWFLWMLFWVFVLSWPLYKYLMNHKYILLLTIAFCYGVSIVGNYIIPNYFGIWTALSYMPTFWCGIIIRGKKLNWLKSISCWKWIIADIALCVFSNVISLDGNLILKLADSFLILLTHIVGALMAFFVLQHLAIKFEKIQDNNVFDILKKHSFTVYLLHQQIIYVCISILNGKINPYIHVLVIFAIALCLSIIISQLLNKSKITSFLVGNGN